MKAMVHEEYGSPGVLKLRMWRRQSRATPMSCSTSMPPESTGPTTQY